MKNVSPESPEQRGKRGHRAFARIRPGTYPFEVVKRVAIGVYTDGFIHAGNLAYLAIVTLFPFFIVAAAVASAFGRTEDGIATVQAFLNTVPPSVAELLAKPIFDVLSARTGSLLWLGALVGLWTTGSFIETIRDILRRAYGVEFGRPFWEYRLWSIGLIVGSVILLLLAFSAQVVLTGVEEFVMRVVPGGAQFAGLLSASRLAPALALFAAMYILFYSLTPSRYRYSKCPKWPGALFTALWWMSVTALLPVILSSLGGYDLTYGSLAGVMIALIFFFFVGLGVVIGAQLNAALAEPPSHGLGEDNRTIGPAEVV